MLDFWENQLKFYFTNEEQVLLPLMKRTQPSTHRFLTDHAYIQNLVSRITDKDNDINKGAADLTHRIDDHIRFDRKGIVSYAGATAYSTPVERNRCYIKS